MAGSLGTIDWEGKTVSEDIMRLVNTVRRLRKRNNTLIFVFFVYIVRVGQRSVPKMQDYVLYVLDNDVISSMPFVFPRCIICDPQTIVT